LTVEAAERITIEGDVFKPLDETVFRESLADLKRQKPEAIAISLLNSFANKAHEEKVREIIKDEFGPDIEVVTSADVRKFSLDLSSSYSVITM
jgi:5-oxoprolinase (ATP-hydrolysing)